MKRIILILLILSCMVSHVFAESSQYSKPTESEFAVYKYFQENLWNLPPGKAAEESLAKETAVKFGITAQDVKNIDVKFLWYEIEIATRKPGFNIGDIVNMSWLEVEKWVDGTGNNDAESSKKIDINKLPSWFTIDKEFDQEKAERLIEAYKITKKPGSKYADSFLVIGDYAKAADLYFMAYESLLETGRALFKKTNETMGIIFIKLSMDLLAKSQYLTLFISPEASIEELYALYNSNQLNRIILMGGKEYVTCDGKLVKFSTAENGITKHGVQSLVDVNAMIKSRMKKLGYSPEDF